MNDVDILWKSIHDRLDKSNQFFSEYEKKLIGEINEGMSKMYEPIRINSAECAKKVNQISASCEDALESAIEEKIKAKTVQYNKLLEEFKVF